MLHAFDTEVELNAPAVAGLHLAHFRGLDCLRLGA